MFVRYVWNKYRVIGSRNNILFNWRDIDNTALSFGLPEPIDERNLAFGYIYTISPTLINEFRFGYQRRNDPFTRPPPIRDGPASGIPGVGPQTFPGFVHRVAVRSIGPPTPVADPARSTRTSPSRTI